MNADAIVKRILEDARAQADQTLQEARERVEQMRRESEDLIESRRAEAMRAARAECEQVRSRMLRMAQLERRKDLLAMKREVIGQAFDLALARMRAMPGDQARAFLAPLVAEAAQGGEQIIPDEADAAVFDAQFVRDVARKCGKALTLASETRNLGGGVLLCGKGVEVNLSYPAILSQRRAGLEAEVAQVLFEPGEEEEHAAK